MLNTATLIEELCEAGRLAGARGLLWGTGGNLSARLGDDDFLITGRGTTLDRLAPDDLVQCAVDADREATSPAASSEVQLHRRVYQRRPDVRCVLHLSPPYATLAACTGLSLPHDLIPEAALYLGPIARIAYVLPGTDELGLAVSSALGHGAAVLMGNHGATTVGATIVEALRRMETLEFLARLVITARSAGLDLDTIGPEATTALRHSVYG